MYRLILKLFLISMVVLPTHSHAKETEPMFHVDIPDERGAGESMPWHFHTGEGLYLNEIPSGSRRPPAKMYASCELRSDDPECLEKVYFFKESEILYFVETAVKLYESDLESHEFGMALSSAVLLWTGKLFWAGLVAPDPTIIASKIASLASGAVAGAMAIVTAWEGKKIIEIHEILSRVEAELAAERHYVQRCDHVSRDFLSRMAELGVEIKFLENAFDLIPPHHYFDTLRSDQRLIPSRETRDRAAELACGQLPMVRS